MVDAARGGRRVGRWRRWSSGSSSCARSGIYFIMVTLAFAQMFYFVFLDTKFGGGSDGINMNFKPERESAASAVRPRERERTSITSCWRCWSPSTRSCAAAALAVRARAAGHPQSTSTGCASLGFPVFRYKLASFTLAGALAGLAGYLSALQIGYVNPELLSWHERAT